jgi:hypothetical protein
MNEIINKRNYMHNNAKSKLFTIVIITFLTLINLILISTPFIIAQEKPDSDDAKETLKSMGITPYPDLKELQELKFKDDWMQVETISPANINNNFSNIDDLSWLKPIAQKNKVVLLGEYHYYKYIDNLRNRMIFALNTFDRYHLLVLELQYSSTGYMEYYVNIKDDAKAEEFNRKEMYEMLPTADTFNVVEYIRIWNKTHPDKFIHVGCHDIEHDFKTTIQKIIVPYFKKLDAAFTVDLEMINWRDLGPLLKDVEERLQKAKKENVIGEYPFITPQYIECVLENLRSLYYSKKYEFNYYREKAMVRNLIDPRYLGKFFQEGKVMMHCGGYHASKYLNYPEGGNFFREGSYLTHEFELTKGKTYSLLVRGFAYQLGPMADINLDSYVRYGSGYTNTIKTYQKAKEKGLVTPEGYYLFNSELDDFSKMVFKKAYDDSQQPMIVKNIDWENIISKAKAESQEMYEAALEIKDTFDQFNAVILIPKSPMVQLKKKID